MNKWILVIELAAYFKHKKNDIVLLDEKNLN